MTTTTGLVAVTPINAAVASALIPTGNSATVDPTVQFDCGKGNPPAPDKAGKDNNYRGITEFGGALYFTKGSGSNGKNTVYTVNTLPSVTGAPTTTISIVPGFPTDCARATGGDYTPFAVFFANPTTMYVTDEGTGNATDASMHAGLEKWSLVKGVWQLDYVLTANGTVTLWATTSTSSALSEDTTNARRACSAWRRFYVDTLSSAARASGPSAVTTTSATAMTAMVHARM